MIAEYERAKIIERCRRGKQHAARRGSVNVLGGAPYGYRYVSKHEGGGEARYQVGVTSAFHLPSEGAGRCFSMR
jgi:site-specific DNA recombinase